MKVVITGATGLIGRKVGLRLTQLGHEAVVISRQRPETVQPLVPFPCRVVQWDGQAALAPGSLTGVTGVVHLAGEPIAEGRWTKAKKASLLASRDQYSRNLIRELTNQKLHLEAYVGSSAIGYYGDRGDEILDESSTAGEGFLAEVCKAWESAQSHPPGVSPALIRTGVVLSREGGALAKMVPPFRWGVGGVLAGGRQWMSWIHISDLVELIVQCLQTHQSGIFNGVAPEPVTNRVFTQTLADLLKVPAVAPVPAVALKALFGEMASAVLGSQRVISTRHSRFQYPTLQAALTECCDAAIQGTDEFYAEQWVDAPVEDVFRFFSDEKNLERITPPFLNFAVKRLSTPHLEQGSRIDYTLKVHGLPLRWRTHIESWEPNRSFVDNQTHGPFKTWHHTHTFSPLGRGTLVRDRVIYKLPLGLLGKAVAGWKVRSDIHSIFAYRRQALVKDFPYRQEVSEG